MAFSLGSLAGGLASGIDNGVGVADKLRQLNDAARVRAARSALGRSYASDLPMTDGSAPLPPPVTPPSPGVASVPATPPPPPDAAPPPDAGPPPIDSSMGGAPSNDVSGMGGAPAPPSPLPPPMPQVQQPPNVPATGAGPATGADGTALSGTAASTAQPGGDAQAQLTSTVTDANNTIKAIAAAVKQANPNIDPETLFEAVNQHIGQMKGVRNEVKDYMQTQVAYAKIQQQMQDNIARIAGRSDVQGQKNVGNAAVANIKGNTAVEVGQGHDTARETAADTAAKGKVTAAQIAAQGGITKAQLMADNQRFIQDAHDKTRVYDTQLGSYTKLVANNNTSQAAVDSSVARAGGTPPARTRLNPLPMPAAPASGNTQYKSLADLQAAFKAGKVDPATAQRIAKTNGWAR